MPRKVARQRTYVIPFVGAGLRIQPLDVTKNAAVARALGRSPSKEFMSAYISMLEDYVAYRAAVTSSRAGAVQSRIEAVVNSATALKKSLGKLELTDRMLFGRGAELDALAENIAHFLPMIEESLIKIRKEKKQGRMPAFAERGLASGLCQILHEETGVTPTTKANGPFDLLLRLALDQTQVPKSWEKDRKDVADLMRLSLREHPTDQSLLPVFSLLSPLRAGTNKTK